MLLLRKPVLSRRELLAIASVSCGGSPGWGADQDNGSLMMDFMRELDAADTLRRRNLDTVRKLGATERALHQKVLRVMIGGIGAFPKRTPRNSVHVGEIRRDDYVNQEDYLRKSAGQRRTANLYRPKIDPEAETGGHPISRSLPHSPKHTSAGDGRPRADEM